MQPEHEEYNGIGKRSMQSGSPDDMVVCLVHSILIFEGIACSVFGVMSSA